MSEVIDNVNFEDRRDLVLLKALLVWVKTRFAVPLEMKFEKDDIEAVQQIQAVDTMKKSAYISEDDAWLIERNSVLFATVAKTFLHDFLPKELFQNYGECIFNSNRRGSLVDIALIPITLRDNVVTDAPPCSMFIVKKPDIVEMFSKNGYYSDENVDIVPLLKTKIGDLLTSKEQALITHYYNKYKDDLDVAKHRDTVTERKDKEDRNLKAALRAIDAQGHKDGALKLAVTLHAIIKSTFKLGRQQVTRINFNDGGKPDLVPDYSRLLIIKYDTDLEQIKQILEPILDSDIKIKIGDHRILFTTGSGMDPDDEEQMANVVSSIIYSEKGLDRIFETNVGPLVSVDDVNKIRDKYLQQKYQR